MVDVRKDKSGALKISIAGGSGAFAAGGICSGGKRFGAAGPGA